MKYTFILAELMAYPLSVVCACLSVMDTLAHTITVKYAGTPTILPGSPKTIACIGPGNPVIAGDSAKFISQSVPTTMATGRTYAVTVTMQNNGSTTWTSAANYNLGSQNPQDNLTWGFARVGLPGSTPVAAGGTVTFSFNVTAPTAGGGANFQWRIVHDGVAWFGDLTTNVPITLKQAQTITFPTPPDKTNGDAPFTISATATSGLAVTFASTTTAVCTVAGTTVTLTSPGTCTITASQAGDATYAAEQTAKSFQVLTAQAITGFTPATPITYVSGGTFTLSATGGASGNPVTFASTTSSICSVSGNTVTVLAVGTCTLTANQAGNASYSAALEKTANVVISTNANQTITFNPLANRVYSTTPFTVSATSSSGLAVTFSSSTQSVCAVAGSTVTMLTVGTCGIAADQAGNVNFTPAPQVVQSFTITSDTVVYLVHADHLGTPRAITASDASNTKVWEWGNEDPFGNNVPNEDPNSTGTAFKYNNRFQGQYFDQETGTYYNFFRDYDPTIGRYVQSDPIGLRGGINTYAYVSSSPLSYVDPKGQVGFLAPVAVGLGALYGGYKAGGIIAQKLYDGYCLAADALDDSKRQRREMLEHACLNNITGACKLLEDDRMDQLRDRQDNVKQGGNLSNVPAGPGGAGSPIEELIKGGISKAK